LTMICLCFFFFPYILDAGSPSTAIGLQTCMDKGEQPLNCFFAADVFVGPVRFVNGLLQQLDGSPGALSTGWVKTHERKTCNT
jgi:hypothetical protein